MSTGFGSVARPVDSFDDDFDVDLDLIPPAMPTGPGPIHDQGDLDSPELSGEPSRPPLQFMPPATAPVAVESANLPAAAGFNPVGDLVASASNALSEVSVP